MAIIVPNISGVLEEQWGPDKGFSKIYMYHLLLIAWFLDIWEDWRSILEDHCWIWEFLRVLPWPVAVTVACTSQLKNKHRLNKLRGDFTWKDYSKVWERRAYCQQGEALTIISAGVWRVRGRDLSFIERTKWCQKEAGMRKWNKVIRAVDQAVVYPEASLAQAAGGPQLWRHLEEQEKLNYLLNKQFYFGCLQWTTRDKTDPLIIYEARNGNLKGLCLALS